MLDTPPVLFIVTNGYLLNEMTSIPFNKWNFGCVSTVFIDCWSIWIPHSQAIQVCSRFNTVVSVKCVGHNVRTLNSEMLQLRYVQIAV
jgi:hypothetical protein